MSSVQRHDLDYRNARSGTPPSSSQRPSYDRTTSEDSASRDRASNANASKLLRSAEEGLTKIGVQHSPSNEPLDNYAEQATDNHCPQPGNLNPMQPLLLTAHAATSCPVKTQNRFNPALPQPEQPLDEGLQELFAGGSAFENQILDLLARIPGAVDLREAETHEQRLDLTQRAVSAGLPVIINPALPVDEKGHRRGSPSAILRGHDRDDEAPGYLPLLTKRHRILEKATSPKEHTTQLSPISASTLGIEHADYGRVIRTRREPDLLQLAHYWRILEAAGWEAGGTPMATIVGNDQVTEMDGDMAACWVDLTERFIRTFSASSQHGWKLRSPLERYDHEHTFRVSVATTAQEQRPPMVSPIRIPECDRCPWWEHCRDQFHDQDLSLRIEKTPLDVREISVLRGLGIMTLEDLAEQDLEALFENYLPQVRHRHGAESRLRIAARRARLMLAGTHLERTTEGSLHIPEARVEVDFDLETTSDDTMYLWGFAVSKNGNAPEYVHFDQFSHMNDNQEIALAKRALTWLSQLLDEHPDALIFHYSDFETIHLHRIASRAQDPELSAMTKRVVSRCVDMFAIMRSNFFGVNGLGLKEVASRAAGFEWRDEDPGGLNSQRWFEQAVSTKDRSTREQLIQRIIDYNADDVMATYELRKWLRSDEQPLGEGSSADS